MTSSWVASRTRNVSGPTLNRSPERKAISETGLSLTQVRESIDLTMVRFSPTRIRACRSTMPSTCNRIPQPAAVPIKWRPGTSAIADSPQWRGGSRTSGAVKFSEAGRRVEIMVDIVIRRENSCGCCSAAVTLFCLAASVRPWRAQLAPSRQIPRGIGMVKIDRPATATFANNRCRESGSPRDGRTLRI